MPEYLHPGVYVEELPRWPHPIEGVETSITAFIGPAERGPINVPVPISQLPEFNQVFGGLGNGSPLSMAIWAFFLNGGARAIVVRVDGRNGSPVCSADVTAEQNRATQTGLYALDKVDLFNLLCIPPYTRSSDLSAEDWEVAARYCVQRRALFLADAPANWTIEDAAAKLATLRIEGSENIAVYFPRILMVNPSEPGEPTPQAPCGFVAGLMSRFDRRYGVWKAPAGTDAVIEWANRPFPAGMNDEASALLSRSGLNVFRTFVREGMVVWGARTLAAVSGGPSEWKYIPVRRLALYMQESILRGTNWAVFEPNGEKTWAMIREQIGGLMFGLFRNGAFQGAKPEQAFYVRCDRTTMTQADIDSGHLNIEIGFAPLRPAEFVVIQLRQIVKTT
jgi:phage tail sheath protein FI